MIKSREEYSENLESQYRHMERAHDKIINDFEGKSFSKNSKERLDIVYDFFLVCYHLREWIKKDSKVDQAVKDNLPTFTGNNSSVQFQMCRDLCNKFKHVVLERAPNDENTEIITYGGSLVSVSGKELEEASKKKETIHLKEEDEIFLGNYLVSFRGKSYDLKGVVQSCMHVWKEFFKKNDLLLPRSTPYNTK
ncbi:MAG: hypothetical protein HQ536_00870 [Parcubacteria group bacterium]|nr:hypothetical protein [Parcubacteria group bacterium]